MFDIGLDMDGCMIPFDYGFRKYVVDAGIRTLEQCPEVTEMDFYLKWFNEKGEGIPHEEFLEICHAGVDAGIIFFEGDPYPDVKDAVDRLKKMGNKIHVITDRTFGKDNYSEVLTERWLKKWEIPYDTLTFSADKTIVSTDIMIDDKPENYDRLDSAGCYSILYDRPWNQMKDNRRRVSSFTEFADLVEFLMMEELFQFKDYGKVDGL